MWFAVVLSVGLLGTACSRPSGVVEEAAQAARDGDRARYLACFTPRSQPMIEALWLIAERDRPPIAALGAGSVRILGVAQLPQGKDGRRRAVVKVEEGGRTMSLVIHGMGGGWRIDLIDTERILKGFGAPPL